MKTHSMPSSRDPKPSARPRSLAALALVAAGLCAATAHASIVNPSFEDAYNHPRFQEFLLPVGWDVFDAHPDAGPSWWEESGVYIWRDEWGLVTTPTDGTRKLFITLGARIWQTVTLTAGDQILLDVAIFTSPWPSGSAGMWISNGQSIWSSSLEFDTGGGFNTGWQQLTLTVPASGTYELSLFNHVFDYGGVLAFFDNIRVIPTPGAAALLGLSSVLVARRRRRSEEHSPVR
jgi:hypothetical protein